MESEAAYDDLSKALPKKKLTVDPKHRYAQPIKTKRVMKVATIDEALELSGGFGRFQVIQVLICCLTVIRCGLTYYPVPYLEL